VTNSVEEKSVDDVEQWTAAAKETRDAAKWFIITLGAVAAAIFGAGPAFLTSTYRLPEDWAIVATQTASAIVALLAIAYMIREVSHLLAPIKVNLEWIANRPSLEALFNRAPDIWYPTGVQTVRQFRNQLLELRDGMGKLQSGIAYNEARVTDLGTSSTSLDVASRDPEIAAAEDALRRQRQYLPAFKETLLGAQQLEKRIVSEAALVTLQQRFLMGKGLRNASFVAIIATVVFVTTLSLRPASDVQPAPPEVGSLIAASTPEAATVWDLLGLKDCESRGQVPVLILTEEADAAKVETIPWTAQCAPKVFTLTNAVGSIVKRGSTQVSVTTVTVTTTSNSPPP
jgi:hypothetical protein